MNYVKLIMMYRDGTNFKTHFEDFFKNKKNYSKEFIIKGLPTDYPVIAQDFGISSEAPIGNEFLNAGEVDHSYCEIVDVEEIDEHEYNDNYEHRCTRWLEVSCEDISEVLKRSKDLGYPEKDVDSDPELCWGRMRKAKNQLTQELSALERAMSKLKQREIPIDA